MQIVVPPITGGLHCGFLTLGNPWDIRELSSRRSPAGSIAASIAAGGFKDEVLVVPPITGGLHCGLSPEHHDG